MVGFSPKYVMLCCVAGGKRHYMTLDKQTVCIAHTISGMLFVEDPQNLMFIITYTLRLHNTANTTNRMLTSNNTRMKPNTTNKELANHWCMIRTNLPHQKAGHLGVPEERSRDTRHISFNNGTVPGKTGRMGNLL